jgi:hypothetical protein
MPRNCTEAAVDAACFDRTTPEHEELGELCEIRFGLPLDLCGGQAAGFFASRIFSEQFSEEFG